MIIKHQLNDGRNLLKEQINQPIVYLDNWALNDVALTSSFRQRFIALMNNTKGTLRLSFSNVVELLNQNDQKQISAILSMIDSVDAGFINTNFVAVINYENKIICGEANDNPSQDLQFIYTYLLANNWPETWTISEVIRSSLDNNSGSVSERAGINFP